MGIGGAIFVMAVGAILAFAVRDRVDWINLTVVGWVLILAGLVWLVLSMRLWERWRKTSEVHRETDPRRVDPDDVPPPPL